MMMIMLTTDEEGRKDRFDRDRKNEDMTGRGGEGYVVKRREIQKESEAKGKKKV